MKKLKKLRLERNIQIEELLSLLKINNDEYFKLENNEIKLYDHQLIKLSNFYNVSIDYILGLTDIPDIYQKNKV